MPAMEGLDELCCELRGNVLTPDEGAAFEAALEEWAASLSEPHVWHRAAPAGACSAAARPL